MASAARGNDFRGIEASLADGEHRTRSPRRRSNHPSAAGLGRALRLASAPAGHTLFPDETPSTGNPGTRGFYHLRHDEKYDSHRLSIRRHTSQQDNAVSEVSSWVAANTSAATIA
jgi:hypothetical protein